MSHKKGLLRGAKFNQKHSTVIPTAIALISAARGRPEVTKIVISIINPAGNAPPRLKFTPIPAGLKMIVRGSQSVQDFYIYTTNAILTQSELEKIWQKVW